MNNLKSKTVRGGLFLTLTNVFSQVFAVVLNVFLARLLLPEDFGLIALSTTYIGLINLTFNIGLGSAIIHYDKATKSNISTLYYLNFIISFVSFMIVFFTARYAANFYGNIELEYIVKWSSLSILMTPFFITHFKIFERDLEFKKISLIIIFSTILSAFLTILAVLKDFGVYALVIQTLSIAFFKLLFTIYYSKWKPNLSFRFEEVKYMIWYSVKYRISQGALYLERNIDYLLLGKILTSTLLGYYAFSYNIMYTPVKRISNIFKNILFPTFSKFKDNKNKILLNYFKSLQIIAFVSFPSMTLIAFNAKWIILAIFGQQWVEAVPIVEILCFAGAFQSLGQFGDVVFDSIGKPEISLYLATIRTVLIIISILVGSYHGVIILAYLIVLSKFLSLILILFAIKHQIDFEVRKLWKYVSGTVYCLFIVIISQILFIEFLNHYDGLVKFLFQLLLAFSFIFFTYREILMDLYITINSKKIIK